MAFGSVLQHTQHNIGRAEPSVGVSDHCAGCNEPILDKFLLNVSERRWHISCVRCCDCLQLLAEKCFSRESKLYCKKDFFRRYGTKCTGCGQGISPEELVRKSRDNKVFHLNCMTCFLCRRELSTGDQLYILHDNKFLCEKDYELSFSRGHHSALSDPLLGSASEDEEDDEPTHHIRGGGLGLSALVGLSGNPDSLGSLGPSDMSVQSVNSDSKMNQDDSDQGSIDGDPDCRGDSQAENKSPDDGANGSKRRGPRTTIKAKQLDVLKNAFSQTPKPTRHIREQLAKETGLPMRVIQVWFQNKRSKERRLKQLTSMNRGPFFGGRKMRGFPMNLSPGGLDEAGFPYFGHDGKFGFPYGEPPFHSHADAPFFPGHPIGPMPFNASGGPIDHPNSMQMVNEFGNINPESNFMSPNASNQGNNGSGPGSGVNPDHVINGQRNSSPSEFIGSGGFSEPQNIHNEGLVW